MKLGHLLPPQHLLDELSGSLRLLVQRQVVEEVVHLFDVHEADFGEIFDEFFERNGHKQLLRTGYSLILVASLGWRQARGEG